MIIDLILDRKDNIRKYNTKKFYNNLINYYTTFLKIIKPIINTLNNKTKKNIKKLYYIK